MLVCLASHRKHRPGEADSSSFQKLANLHLASTFFSTSGLLLYTPRLLDVGALPVHIQLEGHHLHLAVRRATQARHVTQLFRHTAPLIHLISHVPPATHVHISMTARQAVSDARLKVLLQQAGAAQQVPPAATCSDSSEVPLWQSATRCNNAKVWTHCLLCSCMARHAKVYFCVTRSTAHQAHPCLHCRLLRQPRLAAALPPEVAQQGLCTVGGLEA